jgi:hypothetical protein
MNSRFWQDGGCDINSRFWQDESAIVRIVLIAYSEKSWVPNEETNGQYYRWSHRAGVAAVLRALADHRPQRRTLDGPQDHWDPDERTRRELRNIAEELESSA